MSGKLRLISARRLIDGTRAPAVDWPAVLVDGAGRLAYVGPRRELPPIATTVERIDLGSRTLLPGIIDAHVHLAFDGGSDPAHTIQTVDDATLLQEMAERAARLLRSGVTAARDCGARAGLDLGLRDAIAAGRAVGPRLVVAGTPLTIPGGHCYYLGGCTPRGESNLRDAARRQLAAGTDWVKVMVSGGLITPGSDPTRSQFDLQEIRAAAEQVHAVGRRLATHAHAAVSIADAVAAGADSIEHCTWVSPNGRIAYDPAVAQEMAQRGTYACVTIHHRFAELAAHLGDGWGDQYLETVVRMHAAGVPIAFGTDAGVPYMSHDRWADSLVWLGRAGLSPLEAIHAATGSAAACIGLSADVGTLAAGKLADIVAVDGDPSRDLACLTRVDWVMQGGRVAYARYSTNHEPMQKAE